jgi:hypothetical protein
MNNPSINPSVQNELEVIEFLNIYLPHCASKTHTMINAGGCGVHASILYNELKKLGLNPTPVAMCDFSDGENDEELKALIKKRHENMLNFLRSGDVQLPMSPSHIVIQIDREVYVDCKGIVPGMDIIGASALVKLTKEQLDALIEKSDWNPIFDRDCTAEISTYLSTISEEFELWKNGKEYEFVGGNLSEKTVSAIKHQQVLQNPFAALLGGLRA